MIQNTKKTDAGGCRTMLSFRIFRQRRRNYGESQQRARVAGICLPLRGRKANSPQVSGNGDDYRATNNNK